MDPLRKERRFQAIEQELKVSQLTGVPSVIVTARAVRRSKDATVAVSAAKCQRIQGCSKPNSRPRYH